MSSSRSQMGIRQHTTLIFGPRADRPGVRPLECMCVLLPATQHNHVQREPNGASCFNVELLPFPGRACIFQRISRMDGVNAQLCWHCFLVWLILFSKWSTSRFARGLPAGRRTEQHILPCWLYIGVPTSRSCVVFQWSWADGASTSAELRIGRSGI